MRLLIAACFISLCSFNIVDRLASPFSYEEEGYSYQKLNKSENNSKTATVVLLGIMTVLVLFLPPSRRYKKYRYLYEHPELYIDYIKTQTPAAVFTRNLVNLFLNVSQKKYFSFDNNYLLEKEAEVKKILDENKVDYNAIIQFAYSAVSEMFNYLKGKENKLFQISTKPLFKKISDPLSSPLSHNIDYQITSIHLVNFRYSIYEKAFSVYVKYKTSLTQKENGIFVTFIEDEGFKLSTVEKEGESYVLKLDSFFTQDKNFSILDTDKIKQLRPEIRIAEIFYEVYSWWQGEKEELNQRVFLDKELYSRILSLKEKIKKEDIKLNITKLRVSNIEILNIQENLLSLSIKIIARIVFIINGSFLKSNITLISNEEKISDEIWEFEVKENKIYLASIVKKEGRIEPNPLQIEWHI